jgi:hypothetical protein
MRAARYARAGVRKNRRYLGRCPRSDINCDRDGGLMKGSASAAFTSPLGGRGGNLSPLTNLGGGGGDCSLMTTAAGPT